MVWELLHVARRWDDVVCLSVESGVAKHNLAGLPVLKYQADRCREDRGWDGNSIQRENAVYPQESDRVIVEGRREAWEDKRELPEGKGRRAWDSQLVGDAELRLRVVFTSKASLGGRSHGQVHHRKGPAFIHKIDDVSAVKVARDRSVLSVRDKRIECVCTVCLGHVPESKREWIVLAHRLDAGGCVGCFHPLVVKAVVGAQVCVVTSPRASGVERN